MSAPTMYLLLGPPGVGKLTIARALVALLEEAGQVVRLVDNHAAADVLFPLVPEADGASPLPASLADRLREVNRAVLRTIDELSPASWSFVLTHHLTRTEANATYVAELRAVAERRGARFVTVLLDCRAVELRRRVAQPGRHGRKLVDPDVAVKMANAPQLQLPAFHRLDVTSLSPDEAALVIAGLDPALAGTADANVHEVRDCTPADDARTRSEARRLGLLDEP